MNNPRILHIRLAAILAAMLLTLCLPLCVQAAASVNGSATSSKSYTISDVPNVHIADASQYVSDPTSILSPASRDSINAMLARLEKSKGIESAVVLLPSIGDADIFQFAHDLFRTWGIGKKKANNGLLVVLVLDQRKVRFTTGYGLEGTLTDALSRRIQTQWMIPCFKKADWDGGMVAGIGATVKVLDESEGADGIDDSDDDDGLIGCIVAVIVIVCVTIIWIVIAGEKQRCPVCKKKAMKPVSNQILRDAKHRRIRRITYICPHCGHIVKRDQHIDNNPGGGFYVIPGGFGGSGGSGGTSGGSFGGGSTGGGGATSGW